MNMYIYIIYIHIANIHLHAIYIYAICTYIMHISTNKSDTYIGLFKGIFNIY